MYLLLLLLINLPSIACVICALILALKNKDGWGWFLFVALLLAATSGEVVKIVQSMPQ